MKTRDLACLTASFVAASILTTGGAAMASFRRIPALTCVPVLSAGAANPFTVGYGAAWMNTSSFQQELYCPIEEHADTFTGSGYDYGNNDSVSVGGGTSADKYAANTVWVDLFVHESGFTNSAAACVSYNTSYGIDCGANASVPSTAPPGWHNLSLDLSAWHNGANGSDYTYVLVTLAPSYTSQLQGVVAVDN